MKITFFLNPTNPKVRIILNSHFHHLSCCHYFLPWHSLFIRYMQKKEEDFQHYGICRRLFNFIMNSFTGRGNGGETVDSEPKDNDSDPAVKIHFKQTKELVYSPPVDKLGSSAGHLGKEIPLQNGVQGEGSVGTKKTIIPITNRAGQNERKQKVGNEFPTAEPMLTGLGLNINEVSENYIAKTKRKMSENLSFKQHEDS